MRTSGERRAYIEERARRTDRQERLWVRDDWRKFDILEVPVDGLLLNAENRRFRVERMWAEERLGRALDPENVPGDSESIESLLLDTSHRVESDRVVGAADDASEALKNDWLRRRQETPLWIRPDGTVRNGNRRLAMIQRLRREGGDAGLQWVDCIILPEDDIDEVVLLEMEQREQLTENFKVRYNDIDYLLALKEAAELRDVDWFDREILDRIAGELQTLAEKSRGEVLRDLYAIKYMDLFLDDAKQPGQYHRMLRTLERFRDIGRMMLRVEAEYPTEADEILQVLFAAVRSGVPHQDIRAIRLMHRKDRERFDALASQVAAAEEGVDGLEPTLSTPDVVPARDSEDEGDDDDADEDVGVAVDNYPRDEIAAAIKLAIDGFSASQAPDLDSILPEIRNRLIVLDEGDKLATALGGDTPSELRESVSVIVAWADRYRDLAG